MFLCLHSYVVFGILTANTFSFFLLGTIRGRTPNGFCPLVGHWKQHLEYTFFRTVIRVWVFTKNKFRTQPTPNMVCYYKFWNISYYTPVAFTLSSPCITAFPCPLFIMHCEPFVIMRWERPWPAWWRDVTPTFFIVWVQPQGGPTWLIAWKEEEKRRERLS